MKWRNFWANLTYHSRNRDYEQSYKIEQLKSFPQIKFQAHPDGFNKFCPIFKEEIITGIKNSFRELKK